MDDKKTKTARIIIFAVIVIAILIVMKMVVGAAKLTTKYNEFTQCLVNKGVKFYGAFWCPHCQEQEKNFGMSRSALANAGLYTECSNPDTSENDLCKSLGIEGYPTWVFPDGSRESVVLPISDLSEKTGCALPTASETKK